MLHKNLIKYVQKENRKHTFLTYQQRKWRFFGICLVQLVYIESGTLFAPIYTRDHNEKVTVHRDEGGESVEGGGGGDITIFRP